MKRFLTCCWLVMLAWNMVLLGIALQRHDVGYALFNISAAFACAFFVTMNLDPPK